jgi:hypothetical protein
MQRLNAAACLLFALLSGSVVCFAAGPFKVEVVQTHTGVKLGSKGLEFVSDSDPAPSHCSGNSGRYSKQFGFHCPNSALPVEIDGPDDYALFYDVRVTMPDEAHLVFHCSTVIDPDCEGLPEYPENTAVECTDFVFGGSVYKDCMATGPSSERIGFYRADLHGDRMTIFGSNWRRSYLQYGTWQLQAPAVQAPEPEPQSEAKSAPAPAPDEKTTQPTHPATAPTSASTTPIGISAALAASQAIDPRVIEQAKAGDAVAQYKLGYDYFLGRGVPIDYVQAAIWWRKAADQGYPEAQNNLGVLYNSGKGVPQSYAEAYFWQNLAAARASGSLQAQFAKNRDESASRLWFMARLKVQQRAAKWAADHPVQPRSHEPTDARRGEYP